MAPDRPITVLWLIKGLGPGGAEMLLVAEATARDRVRFTYEVAYLLPWKDALVPALEQLDVPTECLRGGSPIDLRWAVRLRRRLIARPVDVLHAHSPLAAAVSRLVVRTLPRRVRPVTVSTEHNMWSSFEPATRVANAVTAPLDGARFAVSETVRQSMWPRWRPGTTTVIHGVALDGVRAQAGDRDATRAELGVGPDEVLVVTVANYREKKDYPNVLAAARRAVDACPALRFAAIGQGPLEEEIVARHAELDLGDAFQLLGYRDDARRVIAAADIFMLGSRHEGLPVTVMEALALGVPVVSTAVGGLPEAIEDGVSGLLVAPADPAALADAVVDLAEDPERRAALAAGAAAAAPRFDVSTATREIEARYVSLPPTR